MAGPYQIYLIRHGVAEDRGEAWPDDTKRPLTDQGMSRVRKSMRGLARMGVSFDVVLTSPLVRAKQTAEIVADECDSKPHIVTVESLVPGASSQALIADLEKHSKRARIALVGHEPDLGELAARFVGARQAFSLKKGGICRIDFDAMPIAPPGALRWLLTPRIMRSLKR